jgi:hypothetical protein
MRRKIKNSWNSVFFQFHLSKMPDVIAFKKVFTANTSISSGMKIFSGAMIHFLLVISSLGNL